jgi:hypothetical protein
MSTGCLAGKFAGYNTGKKKVSTGQESSKNQFLSHFFNVITGALPFN